MTCEICGARRIIYEKETVCPKCKSIELLPKESATQVIEQQIEWFNNAFKVVLDRFDKKRLIAWLLFEREKQATDFFTNAPVVNLSEFLADTSLIKEVAKNFEIPGTEEADESNTKRLVEAFSEYIRISGRKILMEEDFGHYVAKKTFDLDGMSTKDLMSNFKFVVNEDYLAVKESFQDNLVMCESDARAFLDRYKEEYEKTLNAKVKPVKRTPEETVRTLFPTLQAFFAAFTRDEIYAKTFDFRYLTEAGISPDFILNFIQHIPQRSGMLSCTNPKQFKRIIRIKFKGYDKRLIYEKLVFSEKNQGIFPFFVELDGNIFFSHNFIRLMCLFYYPEFYRDLFNAEIQRRSNEFEKKIVPEKLEEHGFKVKTNVRDAKNPRLEVDQIAWKDGTLYVIETKIWDLKAYFEHRRIHGFRERDLKGIVDGKKYSTIRGEPRTEDIPSLLDKIKFVKENLAEVCEDYRSISDVKGTIITKSRPIIKEYKGIPFFGFGELDVKLPGLA